jgi:hypothetical protein
MFDATGGSPEQKSACCHHVAVSFVKVALLVTDETATLKSSDMHYPLQLS